jgi:hypothetical protein
MGQADELSPKFGQVVAFHFAVANPDTGATNTDLTIGGGQGTLLKMPAAGSVVGIGVSGNADITAGTAHFHAHKAGTEFTNVSALTVELTSAAADHDGDSALVRPGVMSFDAGDKIGVSYTTDATYAPTTVDYDVVLLVMLDA